MAPIKFEEQLKEKLEKRRIQPSPKAWDALANRLDQHDTKQNHRSFWWLGVAASIVGIVLVTALIFDRSESKTSVPTVVDIENNEAPKTNAIASENEVSQQEKMDGTKPETHAVKEEKPIRSQVVNAPKMEFPKKEMISNEALASNDGKEEEQSQKALENPLNASEFEQAKLNEVIAEINRLNDENHGVTEAEIDSLLKQAEREILTNRNPSLGEVGGAHENTKTVDANALLQDVEAELEQSFRTRVFEALKSGYVTVKTAVAERNN